MAEESQNADDSFATPSVMEFRERKRRTYYVRADKELDRQDFILSFVLCVEAEIQGDGVTGVAGLLCTLYSKDHPDKQCEVFVRHTSWADKVAFVKDLQKGLKVPPTVIAADVNLLRQYMDWKYRSFIRSCKENDISPYKEPVLSLGVQNDNRTWCFGPRLFLVTDDFATRYVDRYSCAYAWTPKSGKTLPSSLEMHHDGKKCQLIKLLKRCLPESTFNAFLLMLGHSWLSMMYNVLIGSLHHIPTLSVIGNPNTGKSWLAELSVCLYGIPVEELCSDKHITESGLHRRSSFLHLPLIVHDLGDIKLMCQMIETVSEHKSYVNSRTGILGVKPSSSVLFTMNHDADEKFAKRAELRAATRTIFVEVDKKFTELDKDDRAKVNRAKVRASQFLPDLLYVSELFLEDFIHAVDVTEGTLLRILSEEGVDESAGSRIAKNHAMTAHATLTVLDRIKDTKVDRDSFMTYLEGVVKQSAFRYKRHRGTAVSLGVSGSDDAAATILDIVSALSGVKAEFQHIPVNSFVRPHYMTQEGIPYVAILKNVPFEVKTSAHGQAFSSAIAKLDKMGVMGKSRPVRFGQVQNGAFLVPKRMLTDADVCRLQSVVQVNSAPVTNDAAAVHDDAPFAPSAASTPFKGSEPPVMPHREISPINECDNQETTGHHDGSPDDDDRVPATACAPSTPLGFQPHIRSRDDLGQTLLALARSQRSQASTTTLLEGAVCTRCHKDLPEEQKMIEWLPCSDCGHQYHMKCGNAPARTTTRSKKPKLDEWRCGSCVAKPCA